MRSKVIRGGCMCGAPSCKMYAYFNSNPSRHYPDNTASDFTIQLPQTILGIHELGVIEVKLHATPKNALFLCSDLCRESIINDHTLPVLRRLEQKTVTPTTVTYVPLKVQDFDTIRFYVSNSSGKPENLAGETRLTLHLR